MLAYDDDDAEQQQGTLGFFSFSRVRIAFRCRASLEHCLFTLIFCGGGGRSRSTVRKMMMAIMIPISTVHKKPISWRIEFSFRPNACLPEHTFAVSERKTSGSDEAGETFPPG